MESLLLRSWTVVAPQSVSDMSREYPRKLALWCTQPGCTGCARFEAEDKAEYEAAHLHGYTVLPWNCSQVGHRELAFAAGVERTPAYLVFTPPQKRPEVWYPR